MARRIPHHAGRTMLRAQQEHPAPRSMGHARPGRSKGGSMKRRKNLPTRYARRIRRGIMGARIVHQLWQAGAYARSSEAFNVVHQFGPLTRRALYREYAKLVTRSST